MMMPITNTPVNRSSSTPTSTRNGNTPSRIPCSATALMTPRMRLTPSATKLSVKATIKSGSMNWTIASPQQQDDAKRRQQTGGHQQDRHVRQPQPGHRRFDDADH